MRRGCLLLGRGGLQTYLLSIVAIHLNVDSGSTSCHLGRKVKNMKLIVQGVLPAISWQDVIDISSRTESAMKLSYYISNGQGVRVGLKVDRQTTRMGHLPAALGKADTAPDWGSSGTPQAGLDMGQGSPSAGLPPAHSSKSS